jgi:hypothetical protein
MQLPLDFDPNKIKFSAEGFESRSNHSGSNGSGQAVAGTVFG